jgi:mono/diheme cytochrome c family protein
MRHPAMSLGLVLLCGVVAAGQEPAGGHREGQSGAGESISGKRLYSSYCAMCHGADGKGGGPFSPQLKTWPPDLTQLKSRNHGVFPSLHVAEVIGGEFDKPAHGSREMPVWGPVFRSLAHGRQDSAQRRIDNLVRYLESLQQR